MPVVIYAPHKKSMNDGSTAKKTQAFIHKLFVDDTAPGLHVEPINTAVDPKVRTGRVDDGLRAVLFKVQSSTGEPHYIFTGVWPHDEAIEIASKSVLKTNPVNGLPELIQASEVPDNSPARPAATVAVPAGPSPIFAALDTGVTAKRLVELGIDETLAAKAVDATSDDELMDLAASAVEWQGLALLDLAAGLQIEDVRATYSLDAEEVVEAQDPSPEDRLIAGLRSRVGQMQFAWIEHDAELESVIASGDFARWRTFLHPEQRRYVDRDFNGAFRLSGGAGTGKTVVLLHRARRLALDNLSARVVLTTFTRNLAEALSHDLRLLDESVAQATALDQPGVCVTGVDAAAHAVLHGADEDELAEAISTVFGARGNRGTHRQTDSQKAWRDAIQTVGDELPEALRSPAFLAAEYQYVVLPHRLADAAAYARVRRPGRKVALGRTQRAAVWKVIEAYRAAAAVEGVLDFAEVCSVAAAACELQADRDGRFLADYVLVDEGQDLSPPQWQFLRSLVADGVNDLFIAEDAQQRIYGQPVVLSRLGIKVVGRSRRLSLNYRTTEQVLQFARSVLDGVESVDLDDEAAATAGYRSARRGPVPEAHGCESLTDELDQAADLVAAWLEDEEDPSSVGILVRDQRTVDVVVRGLEDRGVSVRQVKRSVAARGDRPQVMTMHRAKGMEFKRVLVFAANADLLPAEYVLGAVPDGDRADVMQRERALFYVAATRARDELAVMWEGKGSEFLPVRQSSSSR